MWLTLLAEEKVQGGSAWYEIYDGFVEVTGFYVSPGDCLVCKPSWILTISVGWTCEGAN